MTLGERVKIVREREGLTQEQFANRINLARNTISLVELDKRNLSERSLTDICATFHVYYDWLKNGTDDDPEKIYDKTTSDTVFSLLKAEYDLDDLDIQIISKYLELAPLERQVFKNYIKKIGNAE